ncbi:hypothetical protein OOT00_05060 [Desulfobotulus sp. H1]|uniref:Ethanolamine utilization protein n=1 Tax=Desulfobotulus pelophilus TaxID=2823377 RepID=A0ABT3N7C2_9BACT|nr:hypothetical protein [Desulfobotulus pelophilus]MCW7753353.1 hypothetical protein [Desulfobotulus pelophilus]
MDVDELVRTITREVLRQMTGESPRKSVMVLAERTDFLAERIQGLLGQEAEIRFRGEGGVQKGADRYILPFLSCGSMADLAAGRPGEGEVSEVLSLLLKGYTVDVLDFEYRMYTDTAPGPLYGLYESYRKTLAAYGLKEFVRDQPHALRLKKTLVTEKDILEAQEQGASVLWLSMDAKVTPLAAESAKDLNVRLLKR